MLKVRWRVSILTGRFNENLGNNYKRASFVLISFQIILLSGVTRGSRYSPFFLSNAKLLHWNGHFKPWKSSRSYGSTFEQKLWDNYFIRDPLGLFVPIRKKKSEI